MIIKNGIVFGEDKSFSRRDLYLENGRISACPDSLTDTEEIDASGLYVLPGLVDIHSHGAMGEDLSGCDIQGLHKILQYEYSHGITTYCPTTMTLQKEKICRILCMVKDWQDKRGMSHVAGINMEGPFLDPTKKGAHMEEYIIPADVDFFRECNQLCGKKIRLVTVAPNMEGAMDFIRELRDEVAISLGHSGADYNTARQALEAGACHVTHLFNAMNPLGHRAPGLIAAAAENEDCVAELICDGIHVHESMVRTAFKLFPGRIALISDSMRATGVTEGTYDLGGQQVHVSGKLATLSDGTIAGSASNLYDDMCNAVAFGIPLEEAIAAASMVPAKSIGIYGEVGSLTPGKRADVLLADRKLQLVRVV